MADKDFVPADRQWRTEEIDPHAIACALRGELKQSRDADSLWHINMYYERTKEELPIYILKLHPEKRQVILDIPCPPWRGHKAHRVGVKLTDIIDMLFIEYTNPDTGSKETDICFCGWSRVGERANSIIVSSGGHRKGGEAD